MNSFFPQFFHVAAISVRANWSFVPEETRRSCINRGKESETFSKPSTVDEEVCLDRGEKRGEKWFSRWRHGK